MVQANGKPTSDWEIRAEKYHEHRCRARGRGACASARRAFQEDINQAFYDGIRHKPDTTFGNVRADVLADEDPHFTHGNFCSIIRGSARRG
jgi:hypothetical protein